MAALSKEQILSCNDLAQEVVNIPEWGGDVVVRCLTGEERDELEKLTFKEKSDGTREIDLQNFRAKLISLCVVDENGQRMFSSEDALLLSKKSAKAIDRVFVAAEKLSGLRREDEDKALKN